MGKAKRKINKLRRKRLKKKLKMRVPVAPPTIVMGTEKDYNRKRDKLSLKKMILGDEK